jgi:peptidyl-prolyl cis-trans isomerase C
MMKSKISISRRWRIAAVSGFWAIGLACSAQAAKAQDLLRVNGHAITLAQVEAINPSAATNLAIRKQVVEQLAKQELLAQTTKKIPDTLTERIEAGQTNLKRQVLAQFAVDAYLQAHPVGEAAIKQAYEQETKNLPTEQFWLRWIVVKTPDEAKTVIEALRNGKKGFTDLAIEQSIGQNAELGGALGWQTDRTLPAAVLGVVQKLKIGQIAGPIAFDDGYAIVNLVAKRSTPVPSLDQLKPQIEMQLRNEAITAYIQDLAKSAKIENQMDSETQTSQGEPHAK